LATSSRHNSSMITDRRKFNTKITIYGLSCFYFTIGINSKSFPWPVHSVQKPPEIFCDVRRGLTTRRITLASLSRRQPITIDIESRDTRPRRMQEVKSLCTDSQIFRAEYCILWAFHTIRSSSLFSLLSTKLVVTDHTSAFISRIFVKIVAHQSLL